MKNLITRRGFAAGTSLALGMAALPRPLRASRSPGDKLNIVVIGCGGRGGANFREMLGENVVALCDVNETSLLKAADKAPQARKFRDFRRMYDALKDRQFDAVVVSTTEHTHAFATLPALKRKKHVYCEKPLAHNIREARLITEAAQHAGVATQLGTQIHAGNNFRRVVELVQGGVIGPVREAHVWTGRAWGWQSEEDAKKNGDLLYTAERPKGESLVPATLDWDLWLGPAPFRPFNEVYFPGPKWYRWWDFASGTMSDLGSHMNDLPFWALKLDAPLTVEASGPPPHPELAPASMSATFEFGARGDMPPVKMTWYQGNVRPALWQNGQIPRWDAGTLFVGDKGMLLADYGKHMLLVDDKAIGTFSPFTLPEKSIADSIGHHAEWILACKTGSTTKCHFGYSGRITESNHLGTIAYRSGKKIEWDAKNLRLANAPDAEHFLGREYRKGWTLR